MSRIGTAQIARLCLVAFVAAQAGCESAQTALQDAARKVDEFAARIVPADAPPAASVDADRAFSEGIKAMDGDGVPQSDARAAALFRDAAAQDHPDAQFMLGLMHQTGRGIAQDDAAAVEWFRRAAAQGQTEAQFFLGLAHLRGRGVAVNQREANVWFARAAEQGHSGAQYQLGLAYATGAGVEQADKLAIEWLEKAAEQGHPEAQFFAGQSYANGWGVSVDQAWAARWYGKAAAQGLTKAQYHLGVAYAAGLGLPRNLVEAYKWVILAAGQNDADAVKMKPSLARKLAAAEVAEATNRARLWKPTVDAPFADQPTVRFVQTALVDLGFDPGPADGRFGRRTQQALASYQVHEGLARDGAVTPGVVQSLKAKRAR